VTLIEARFGIDVPWLPFGVAGLVALAGIYGAALWFDRFERVPITQVSPRMLKREPRIGYWIQILLLVAVVATVASYLSRAFPAAPLVAALLVVVWFIAFIPKRFRMICIELQTTIGADPPAVFAVVADRQNVHRWASGFVGSQLLSGRNGMPGSIYRNVIQSAGGDQLNLMTELLVVEPPHRIEARYLSLGRDVRFRYTFEAVPEGTLVSYRQDAEISRAAAWALIFTRKRLIEAIRQGNQSSLRRLDQILRGQIPTEPAVEAPPKATPAGVARSATIAVGTLAVSLVAYTWYFGPRLAVALLVMLTIHELGHLLEARRQGIPVSAPIFIPFVGAAIFLRNLQRVDALRNAQIAVAGPILGSVGAAAAVVAYALTDYRPFLTAAAVGFLLNLFNLIPVAMLDGAQIVAPVSRWIPVAGLLACAGLAVLGINLHLLNPLLVALVVIAIPFLIERFRRDASPYYRAVPSHARWLLAGIWLALVAGLALGVALTI
jgi:Zn-dependent protease